MEETRETGRLLYKVSCDCGNSSQVEASHLVNGQSQSCGCLHKEVVGKQSTKHGMANSRTYKTWEMMVQRTNTESLNFLKYKENGISLCDSWKENFVNFLQDMGKRPKNTTLDRIDNTKGYYKENCRWASNITQAINKGISSKNTSGIKGVNWDITKGRWRAFLSLGGKRLLDKHFVEKEDAILARKEAEDKYFKPLLEKTNVSS